VKILVSNDDGFRAEGIRRLREALATLAEVTVVAPDRNKSGASNSLTLDVPLRVFESEPGVYFVPGTRRLRAPGDLRPVRLRTRHGGLGVNDGANLGDDVLYSGTVAAASRAASSACRPLRFRYAPAPAGAATSKPAPRSRGGWWRSC